MCFHSSVKPYVEFEWIFKEGSGTKYFPHQRHIVSEGSKEMGRSGHRLRPTRFYSQLKSGFTLTEQGIEKLQDVQNWAPRHPCGKDEVSANTPEKELWISPQGWWAALVTEDAATLTLWGNCECSWGEMIGLGPHWKENSPHSTSETLDFHPHGANLVWSWQRLASWFEILCEGSNGAGPRCWGRGSTLFQNKMITLLSCISLDLPQRPLSGPH